MTFLTIIPMRVAEVLGVKHRPFSIVAVSVLYALTGFVLCGLTLFWSNWDVSLWIDQLGLAKGGLILGTFAVSAGIWRVRPWGYFLFLIFSSLLVGLFVYRYAIAPIDTHYYLLVGAVISVGCTAMLLKRHVMAPYFNPKVRWWETSERVRGSLRTEVACSAGTFEAEILDLSVSGCFALSNAGLKVGDILFVKFDHFNIRIFVMTKVVRRVDNGGVGYGLMFLDLSREEKRLVSRLMSFMAETQGVLRLGSDRIQKPNIERRGEAA